VASASASMTRSASAAAACRTAAVSAAPWASRVAASAGPSQVAGRGCDNAYAIHGDADVPLQPISHGCVRVPMDIAGFFHTLVPTPGTPVYIRG
jgi:L,D-transpeptidase catalytic domain